MERRNMKQEQYEEVEGEGERRKEKGEGELYPAVGSEGVESDPQEPDDDAPSDEGQNTPVVKAIGMKGEEITRRRKRKK